MTDNNFLIRISWVEDRRLFAINFEFSSALVDAIRKIPGRRWDPDNKTWYIPITGSVGLLEHLLIPYKSVIVPESYQLAIEKIKFYRNTLIMSTSLTDKEIDKKSYIVPEGLEYFNFQKVAIEWLNQTNGNALIADEMGCGKTIEVLGWINQHPEIYPIIIVCPASVKLNWQKEILKWTVNPGKIVIVNKNTKEYDGKFYIINYDILSNFVYVPKKEKDKKTGGWKNVDVPKKDRVPYNDLFLKIHAQILILDESHYIKDKSAQRTKSALRLARMTPYKVALTGTPFLNRPVELYTVANMLAPKVFDNWVKYITRYCGGKEGNWGWEYKGHSNEAELNQLLRSSIMLRRRKEDVVQDLPEKTRTFVPLECGATSAYEILEKKIINELIYLETVRKRKDYDEDIRDSQTSILTSINQARQEIFELKKLQLMDFILDTLENNENLVIFIYHHEAYRYITEELTKRKISVTGFTGEDNINKRQESIDGFQAGNYRVFVTSTGAGSIGITLTQASTLIFAELDWSLANVMQAEDRIHRIGQHNNVNIYYLIDYDSIEGYIASLLEEKLVTFKSVIDGDCVVKEEDYFGNLVEWARERRSKR